MSDEADIIEDLARVARYKIRKTGRTWKLWHRDGLNGAWHGPVMESSRWENVAWVATGEPTYSMPGFIRWPMPCGTGGSTW